MTHPRVVSIVRYLEHSTCTCLKLMHINTVTSLLYDSLQTSLSQQFIGY